MKFVLNGKAVEIDGIITLGELVGHLKLDGKPLAVEHNGAVIQKSRYFDCKISEGDKIEVVTFVGGG